MPGNNGRDVDYNTGDFLRGVKGEVTVEGPVSTRENSSYRYIGDTLISLEHLLTHFDVTVVKRVSILPTEPGLYITANLAGKEYTARIFSLNDGGQWFDASRPDDPQEETIDLLNKLAQVQGLVALKADKSRVWKSHD